MHKNTLLVVNQDSMGQGSIELGRILIANYFKLLSEESNTPKIIVFYNSGVKLLCEDSELLEQMQNLTDKGCRLLACKTCIKFYNLEDEIRIGQEGSMADILMLQSEADKIIYL